MQRLSVSTAVIFTVGVFAITFVASCKGNPGGSLTPASLTPVPLASLPANHAPVSGPALPSSLADRYLFIEIRVDITGAGNLRRAYVDFPGYQYQPTTGHLIIHRGPELHLASNAWGFVGLAQSRRGAAGSGLGGEIKAIPNLPYTINTQVATGRIVVGRDSVTNGQPELRDVPVTLLGVSTDGHLTVTVDAKRLILAPNQKWQQVTDVDVSSQGEAGHYRITSTLTNYGWHARSQIE